MYKIWCPRCLSRHNTALCLVLSKVRHACPHHVSIWIHLNPFGLSQAHPKGGTGDIWFLWISKVRTCVPQCLAPDTAKFIQRKGISNRTLVLARDDDRSGGVTQANCCFLSSNNAKSNNILLVLRECRSRGILTMFMSKWTTMDHNAQCPTSFDIPRQLCKSKTIWSHYDLEATKWTLGSSISATPIFVAFSKVISGGRPSWRDANGTGKRTVCRISGKSCRDLPYHTVVKTFSKTGENIYISANLVKYSSHAPRRWHQWTWQSGVLHAWRPAREDAVRCASHDWSCEWKLSCHALSQISWFFKFFCTCDSTKSRTRSTSLQVSTLCYKDF